MQFHITRNCISDRANTISHYAKLYFGIAGAFSLYGNVFLARRYNLHYAKSYIGRANAASHYSNLGFGYVNAFRHM